MKRILLCLILIASAANASDSKEYLVDAGTSGYLTATYASTGHNAVMELTDTLGQVYLVPEKNCKIIAERSASVNGFSEKESVLYTDNGSVANVVYEAKIQKLFTNGDALIFVKDYKEQGYHPYLYVDTKTLSAKR